MSWLVLPWLATLSGCTRGPQESPAPEDSPAPDTAALWREDQDGDRWSPAEGDCDDQDATVHPHAEESIDGRDQDCDGVIDDETVVYDDDWDGFTEQEGDCDDRDREIYPDAPDTALCDGVDRGCTGAEEPCDPPDEVFFVALGCEQSEGAYAITGGVDMGGDGRPDLILYDGDLYIWSIPEAGGELDCSGRSSLVMGEGDTLSQDGVALLGDPDGDGLQELAMTTGIGEVFVLSAPLLGGLHAEDHAVARYALPDGSYLEVLDAGRDLSGEGVADLLLGASTEDDSTGSVYLVSGDGRGTLDAGGAFARVHGEAAGEEVGVDARFTGDNDGDGLDDLLVAGRDWRGRTNRAGWFSGPLAGSFVLADADAVAEASWERLCFTSLSEMGDVDGDGRDDLVLHTCLQGEEALYLFTDGLRADPEAAAARIVPGEGFEGSFGHAATVVDVNGDGLGDLVAGAPSSTLGGSGEYGYRDPQPTWSGATSLFLAPLSGTREVRDADRLWAGDSEVGSMGLDVARLGDVNGDGFEDFAVASPAYGAPTGEAPDYLGAGHLFLGRGDW